MDPSVLALYERTPEAAAHLRYYMLDYLLLDS